MINGDGVTIATRYISRRLRCLRFNLNEIDVSWVINLGIVLEFP